MARRVYHYNRYHQSKSRLSKKRRIIKAIPQLVLVGAIGLIIYNVGSKDLNKENISVTLEQNKNTLGIETDLPKPEVNPKWPKNIQSAVGAVGYGVLNESNEKAKPVPMASLAKVMPAILIIEKDSITPQNDGAEITFTKEDVKIYDKYLAKGGVVHEVKPGEKITQKEALAAMLISSSNNLADTAVINSFGSINAYLAAANQKAKELGLKHTTFRDVTGFSPKTKSTASDLILLSEYAMQNELFAQIVSTWQTDILKDTKLTNTNSFLDFEDNNVIGIKTGLTDEAGGTYMSAARYRVGGGDIVALAVTLGAKNHFNALKSAQPLLKSVEAGFNNLP